MAPFPKYPIGKLFDSHSFLARERKNIALPQMCEMYQGKGAHFDRLNNRSLVALFQALSETAGLAPLYHQISRKWV
jgi:hypothetical protein